MAHGPDPVVNLLDWANDIRGFADQLPLWGEFVLTEPLLKEFVLGNVNLPPFSNGLDNAGLVNGARVLCHGRQGNVPVDDQMLLLATIGEAIFPNLRNRRLQEGPARELLRMSVSQILDFPDPDVTASILAKVDELNQLFTSVTSVRAAYPSVRVSDSPSASPPGLGPTVLGAVPLRSPQHQQYRQLRQGNLSFPVNCT
ncbi:unnamed protein product [Bemisia tabaci]|uniref:Uncharacterized protein n=1 Tax=Bemisia tabaci TaxID=7038 RepID=A0AAI8UV07_BEMTA|nr:unnamed protein product [Bemisia tabaci]